MGGVTALIAPALGAGAAGIVGSTVNKFLPSIAGNTAQALGGAALWYFGRGMIRSAGAGVLIKTVGDYIEDNVSLGFSTGGSATTSGTTSGATFA